MSTAAELLAALKLTPPAKTTTNTPAGDGLNIIANSSTRTKPRDGQRETSDSASPTALVLDKWSLRHGKEWLQDSPEALEVFGTANEATDLAAADFLALAFENNPRLADSCEDRQRGEFIAELLATPDYRALHVSTSMSETKSRLAAQRFAESFYAHRMPDGMPADIANMIRAGRAIEEAADGVSELKEIEWALNSEIMLADFDRIKDSERLRRIMQLAGRYRRAAQALQRQKCLHGSDDVVGVELDNDLGRILPAELVTLDDPDLELDTLRRYIERGLMCRKYEGLEKKAAGPVILTCDESGSMRNDGKIENAKAVAASMVWVAHHENRYAVLVGHYAGTTANILVLPPRKPLSGQLTDWLEHFYCGNSTDFTVPLSVVPSKIRELGCPAGKTDIVSITDGICRIPQELADSFNEWKRKENAKLFVIVIGSHGAEAFRDVADVTTNIPELSPDAEAVKEVLSI